MKKTNTTLQRLLLAAAIAMPFAVQAAAPDMAPAMQGDAGEQGGPGPHGGPDGARHGGPGPDGGPDGGPQGGPPPGGMEHGHFGPPPFGHGGPGAGAPFLHGLELSEAQQDKIFAINYAQQPVLRDQQKIVGKSYEALHELTSGGKYDDAKAVALIQAATQAMATITLSEVRAEQQILAVLTPEQRKQIDEHRPGPDGKPGKPGKPGERDGNGQPPAKKKK
jgi:Spy/CpxP family protein refolding chaperone